MLNASILFVEFHMTTELQNQNFSIAEAVDFLRISKSYVWKLIGASKLKRLRIGARSIIAGAELARFIDDLNAAAGFSKIHLGEDDDSTTKK